MRSLLQTSRLAAAAFAFAALTIGAHAQTLGCSTGGTGGVFPSSGTGGGGVFPTSLPTFPSSYTLNVASVPPGATVVTEVKLNSLTHTWINDVHFVLTTPGGVTHNLLVRPTGSCDFGGDYTIVPQCGGGSSWTIPGCSGAFIAPPGAYDQFFGAWPSGNLGILNTPLNSIAAATGTWTLTAYDWVGGDAGNLGSWDLCFGTPAPGAPPTTPPALSSPADGAVFCSSSVTLTWANADCATSYDVDVNGVVTNVAGNSLVVPIATAGVRTWRVRAVNSAGVSAYSAARTFTAGTLTSPWGCVTGGGGGAFPVAGVDGTWPTVLPTGELSSTLAVTVPAGATRIAAVKLNGLSHTWLGDCHIVLTSPAGVNYNIFQQVDGVFGGGCGDDFAGDYSFVDPAIGTDECGTAAQLFACGVTTLPPGVYGQYYGAWNSGDSGIVNVNMSAIPLASGNWTLKIYDWYIPADGGTLVSWDLCFDASTSGPTVYCTAGTSTSGCVASLTANVQPNVSNTAGCVLTASSVDGQRLGLLFYGINNTGFTPIVWGPGSTSFQCVKGPTNRMPSQNSGGTVGGCDGVLSTDWDLFQTNNPGSLGNPWSAGDKAFVQAWYRDPAAPKTTNLSDAVELTIQP